MIHEHYLLHLPEAIRNLSPLYTYSCFPYEGTKGYLLSCIKHTQHVDSQILEAVSISQGLTHIARQLLAPDTEASLLYRSMKATRHEYIYVYDYTIHVTSKIYNIIMLAVERFSKQSRDTDACARIHTRTHTHTHNITNKQRYRCVRTHTHTFVCIAIL